MAYIGRTLVQKCLDDLSSENLIGNENDTFISLAEAHDRINELPTADVAPKSEVEMLQGALKAEERHNELTMEMAQKALKNAKAEVAREIVSIIEKRMELNEKRSNGIHALMKYMYKGREDAYKDIKEIIEQKYTGGDAKKCAYNIDEICVNPDCPYRADYCPCYEEDTICKFREEKQET